MESLAKAMASSIVLYFMIGITGPKVSSIIISMVWFTSVKMVAFIQVPPL